MTDDEFLAAFEECRLPRPEWTHAAHVRLTWLYLQRDSVERVLPVVRAGIRRFNLSLGNSTGYHETITCAFVHLIAHRLARPDPPPTFAEFRVRNADLFDHGLPLLLQHYRRDTLFSAQARETFVEPDREPLPR